MKEGPAVMVKDLWWKYYGNQSWTLKGIGFTVKRGESLGIVGPTGAGKTTLLNCLAGLIPNNFPGTMKGEVYVEGLGTNETQVAELATKVGMVFEDAEAQFVALNVEDDIAFGLENLNLASDEIGKRIRWALGVVGLSGYEKRNLLGLSGGEKQRAAIAGVLAMRPGILLLDEPTAELDPNGKAQLLETITNLKRSHGITIVMVEQDTEILSEIVDRLILVSDGNAIRDELSVDFFSKSEVLEDHSVRPLETAKLFSRLKSSGVPIEHVPLNEEDAVATLRRLIKERKTVV